MGLIEDVNVKWNMVKKALVFDADRFCPVVRIRVRKDIPSWFDGEIIKIGLDRDRLFRIYRRGGKRDHSVYQRAVIKRREFNGLVKRGKKNFIKEQLTLCKGNQVKFWNVINDLIGSTTTKEIGSVFKPGSEIICEQSEGVEIINDFFS